MIDLSHKRTFEYHNGISYRSTTQGVGTLALGAVEIDIGNSQVYAIKAESFDTLKTYDPTVPVEVRRALVARAQTLVDRVEELETAPHPNEVRQGWDKVRWERFKNRTADAAQKIARIDHYLGAYEAYLGVRKTRHSTQARS